MSLDAELSIAQEQRIADLEPGVMADGAGEDWAVFWGTLKREQGDAVLEVRLQQAERDTQLLGISFSLLQSHF